MALKYVKSLFMKKILCILCITFLLSGCGNFKADNSAKLKLADYYAAQADKYNNRSVQLYQGLINSGIRPDLKEAIRLKLSSLYLRIGSYQEAADCLKGIQSQEAQKKLAAAYFKNSQFSDALAQFDKLGKLPDDEYLYYYGQTLEKHNLYDKALSVYALINKKSDNYDKAVERINAINLSEVASSSGNLSEIIRNAPSQEDYPEAGAVILLADEEFEVFSDDTARYDAHMMVKVFNERGKEEFSELQIGYDSTFEEVKIDFARTIKPDGTAVYAGDKNMRDVSIYLNYPLYSNARAKIVSMPEVTDGAIIEYRVSVFHKQLVNKNDFIINYSAQEGEPIKSARFKIKIPKDREINYKAINSQYNKFSADLNPAVSIEGDEKVFSWQMENIPEIIPEPDMPPESRSNPIVMISTFNSWDEIYKWWYDLYKDKIKIDGDIQDKINELVKGKNTDEDKMRAIYNFCAKDIRYVAVEYGQAGYEPHDARDIFKNKYGDCKDQAILLVAMLRSQGIKAYPVLIGTYSSLDLNEDFPSIAFDHCIAAADSNGKWIFMDPIGETVPLGDLPAMDQDRLVFAVLDDGYKIMPTPLFAPEKNYSYLSMQIKIRKDGSIYAKRRVDAGGAIQQVQRYWLQFTKPKLIEEALKSTASGMAAGARLIKYNIENADDLDKDIVLEYEFEAPDFLAKAGKSRLVPQLGGIGISSVVKEERDYPLEYPIGSESVTKISMEIPANLSVKSVPQDVKVNSKWFDFENVYKREANIISFYEKYKFKAKVITQKEYSGYKELVEDIVRKTNQNIILEQR